MSEKNEFTFDPLFDRISAILDQSRYRIVRTVNSQIVSAYWHIGREIFEALQAGEKRAQYGQKLLEQLSEKLQARYGKGFSTTNLKYFRSFYQVYPDRLSSIGHPPGDQFKLPATGHPVGDQLGPDNGFHPDLSWSHYRVLMRVENEKARQFYEKEALAGTWSRRQLERQINSLFYERILASKDKKGMLVQARQEAAGPLDVTNVLKDPYVLEFLNLPDAEQIHESTLETAIITNLQQFLLELGKGFSFVARQKRMRFEDEDFYIDLVFYNFHLKCFLLIDLKIGKLTYQDIGQMDGYVRMFEANYKVEGDYPTIGLILCSEKNEAVARYSVLNESKQLFAAKYVTYLPSEEELERELHRERRRLEEAN
ncbi:PDDEXK nuclease domain-containing protein [uncultured Desulfobacter sp.]|uniref:PDDEXK nuclease domain-containing protein n=1 Tax=uncultured Desulfobacter sp. TaxID=240139 RepID=UPI002AAB844C|nr:PDDEXK nuclease domain-containing protein [uncultured Desulfobacter sp.]